MLGFTFHLKLISLTAYKKAAKGSNHVAIFILTTDHITLQNFPLNLLTNVKSNFI